MSLWRFSDRPRGRTDRCCVFHCGHETEPMVTHNRDSVFVCAVRVFHFGPGVGRTAVVPVVGCLGVVLVSRSAIFALGTRTVLREQTIPDVRVSAGFAIGAGAAQQPSNDCLSWQSDRKRLRRFSAVGLVRRSRLYPFDHPFSRAHAVSTRFHELPDLVFGERKTRILCYHLCPLLLRGRHISPLLPTQL